MRLFALGLVLQLVIVFTARAESFTNYETAPVHPIAISPNGARLAVSNLPAGRLEIYSLTSGTPELSTSTAVGVDPVAVRWRTNTEVWVVNHISDSITIVAVPSGEVLRTLSTGDEPCDVVFAGDPIRAFVSCSQINTLQVFDLANLDAAPTSVSILGEDPRALSVSADGTTVYAAIFESGNGSTILGGGADTGEGTLSFPPNAVDHPSGPYAGMNPPPNSGVVFEPALAQGLPSPPGVGLIVKKNAQGQWLDDNIGDWSSIVDGANAAVSGRYPGWELVDNDIAVVDANTLAVSYIPRLMNIVMAIAVNPASGAVTVVGTDGTNEVRFEPNVNGRFLRVQLGIWSPNVDKAIDDTSVVDLNPHLTYTTPTIAQGERNKSIGDPRGIIWNAAGTRGFITGMGSNNLIEVDATGQRVDANAPTNLPEGPTGLAIDETRGQLYVFNRFASSISVLNLETKTLVETVAMLDPTPEVIKVGRKHLYDTHRTSGLGHVSCASCHIDSRMDRLAWDLGDPGAEMIGLMGQNLGMDFPGLGEGTIFGDVSPAFTDFHPMKGPMTTQTLQDIIGKEPLHWRGDRKGLEQFNPAFVGLQGDDVMLTQTEMQEFEDFLATIHFPPNPNRNFDNTLPENLPLPGQYKSGRFGDEGQPLPNGNAQHGLEIYRRGVSIFGSVFPGSADPIDSGSFSCVFCHTLPLGMGSNTVADFSQVDINNPETYTNFTFQPLPQGPKGEFHHALVSVDGSKQKAIKTPQLRALHDKAGFETTPGHPSLSGFGVLHDGSVDSLSRFVSEPTFDVANYQDVADLVALMLSFSGSDFPEQVPDADTPFIISPPGTASKDAHAAVGKQATMSFEKDTDRINAMLDLAEAGKVDVVVHGTDNTGAARGYLYLGQGLFKGDGNGTTLSTSGLLVLASLGDPQTFTVVPRGSGGRLGLDRDEDGLFDYDETRDYSPNIDGVQNPFDPNNGDSIGDDGEVGPDGIQDSLNDWDGDGVDNATELVQGRNPAQAVGTDIDSSGGVNAVDVQLVINAALGFDIGGLDGDVDGSGDVNASDVQAVINAALG